MPSAPLGRRGYAGTSGGPGQGTHSAPAGHSFMNIEPFRQRRLETIKRMGAGIAIVPTAPEQTRNRDAHFPYRADSYALYLSGFTEPEAVVVLIAGDKP